MHVTTTVVVDSPSGVLLSPRPLARTPGVFLLLPLLPARRTLPDLPAELWAIILEHAFNIYEADLTVLRPDVLKLGLLVISKALKSVALPLYYASVHISSLPTLARFTALLHAADQKWDSIRRIPYSAPGRWVQRLDLSSLRCESATELLHIDALFAQLFPLLPFMSQFVVDAPVPLSRRAFTGLASRDGTHNLRVLRGVQLATSRQVEEDLFVELLRACPLLTELEIFGSGPDTLTGDVHTSHIDPQWPFAPVLLPHLRKFVALSMPFSPTLLALLHTPLPSLRHLTLTPYDDGSSIIPQFISKHGADLTSLHLYAVKQWPTVLFRSPRTLLDTSSNLKHLSLEVPLPTLTLSHTSSPHNLEILSVPRPNGEYLRVIEALLPQLPKLRCVRARDVKWLRNGMSAHAQQAGVQGEMILWRRRLARRGVQMVDAEWKPGKE